MDLYVILGLAPGATTADVKRAYRRLARRYHPGINPGDPAAGSLFRQISDAYETLMDPERRRAYDTAGAGSVAQVATSCEFAGFDFSAMAQGPQAATFTELFADVLHPAGGPQMERPEPGADLHATLTLSLRDALRGVERQVVVTRQDVCRQCRGAGRLRAAEGRCAACQGTGTLRWARGHMVFTKACAACHGTGQQQWQRCPLCAGQGRGVRSEAVTVAVPPGVTDGTDLRVPEKGHAGRNGARSGDLYVRIAVTPDPVFRREGDDLWITVPIGVHEAVLGARIDVPSIDGPVRLRIPPGTQAGQRFRLRERGAPTAAGGRGHLCIEVRIVLPTVVDERTKDVLREFGKLYGDIREFHLEP